ncbi:CBM_collapsed_G0057370.mRNA.1.CDS.1 [Saccharomyces cerevisiae]|nr:CBM_collapsed_G0057370.mRNA.1.CDS.1 [Saccharomyces cerevisiae]
MVIYLLPSDFTREPNDSFFYENDGIFDYQRIQQQPTQFQTKQRNDSQQQRFSQEQNFEIDNEVVHNNNRYYEYERSSNEVSPFDDENPNVLSDGMSPTIMATATAVTNANAPLPVNAQANNPLNFTSAPSRTVYLGNVPPNLSVKELLDHVRSGVVEDVKIIPEKMCAFVSFIDESAALLFHSDAILKRLNIGDRDIKIGWGKPTRIDPIVAARISTDGATRNVYIGRMTIEGEESHLSEEQLRVDLEEYGEIDCIKIIKEKGIAFIHFASILNAIKVVTNLPIRNPYYQNKRIFYGKDRCAFITKTQQHNAAQFLGVQPGMEHMIEFSDREFISNALLQQSAAAAAIATSAGGPNNLGNRTVYLGSLPKDVKIEEICNAVRGGLLQSIKLLNDRYVCFVTFIDPTAAAQFYAMSSLYGFTVQKKRCKVGWGKHSGPLPNALALAVSNGASRNVYVGNIDFVGDSLRDERVFTESNLRHIFQQYGEVEQINFLPEKNYK